MAGADFYELAQYSSDDMTAESGGDLGWFRQDQMVGPFDDKVFSMAPGEVSEPVKTQFGWHIIKLHEFRDNTDTPDGKKVREAHASHILFRVTASAETLDRLHRRLEDFRSAAAEYGFEQSATNFELELLTSGAFTTGSIIDHLGYDPVASEFAFTQELGTISSVLENQNLVYVAQVAEILPAGVAAFEEVKDQVKLDYESFVIKRLCHDTAQAIYAEVEAGTELKGAAGAHGAEYTTPDEFTRNSYIRGLGIAPEAIGAAFALTERGQVSPPIDYARGTVIMQLLERTAPDTTVFADKRDSLSSAILSSKQQELYGSWFDNLVQNSDIINNIESSYQQTEY
jgi:peptidyl-prolyl cis-trans isomerase D